MDKEYFLLFADCIAVKGSKRSAICDLSRNRIKLIPNQLSEILSHSRAKSVSDLKNMYGHTSEIDEYFQFLMDNEFGFFTVEPERFPLLDLTYEHPARIQNAIVDINCNSDFDVVDIISQLEALGCENLQIRAYDVVPIANLRTWLSSCINGRLRSIEIILKFDEMYTENVLVELCNCYQRICLIQVHSAPIVKAFRARQAQAYMGIIAFTDEQITSEKNCGIISKGYFSSNFALFTESQAKNSCLNKKISVDSDGNIKNCPSMANTLGHIKRNSLASLLENPRAKEFWAITKDQVLVCKDCEFRYVCTDCRCYIQDPADLYSKPLKCDYDPYTATWSKNADKYRTLEV